MNWKLKAGTWSWSGSISFSHLHGASLATAMQRPRRPLQVLKSRLSFPQLRQNWYRFYIYWDGSHTHTQHCDTQLCHTHSMVTHTPTHTHSHTHSHTHTHNAVAWKAWHLVTFTVHFHTSAIVFGRSWHVGLSGPLLLVRLPMLFVTFRDAAAVSTHELPQDPEHAACWGLPQLATKAAYRHKSWTHVSKCHGNYPSGRWIQAASVLIKCLIQGILEKFMKNLEKNVPVCRQLCQMVQCRARPQGGEFGLLHQFELLRWHPIV